MSDEKLISQLPRPSSTFLDYCFHVEVSSLPHPQKMFTLLACKERIENEEIPSELLDVYKIQCKAEIDSARYVILHLLTSLSRET